MREGDRVDAEVEQRAAREVGPVHAGHVGELLAVVGDHRGDVADHSGLDGLAQLVHVRQVARPHGLHDEDACLLGGRENGLGLRRVLGKGLLDEDVLAGLDGLDRGLVVVVVRGRDVDGVDVVARHELRVGLIRVASIVRLGELLGLFQGRR